MQLPPELAPALQEFTVSSIAGGIGGIIAGINTASNNSIRLIGRSQTKANEPRTFQLIDLGCIGDLLLGAAAGIAVVFFINIGVTNSAPAPSVDYLRLIPICLMAGVVSKKALAGMSEAVIGKLVSDNKQLHEKQERLREEQERLQDQVKKLDHINELIQEGERHLKEGEESPDRSRRVERYESARNTFLQATEIDQGHSVAYVCLGKSLKRLAEETADRDEQLKLRRAAINAASEAIKLNPTYDRAYYNRACYKALIGVAAPDILNDLEKAIQYFQLNRLYAKSDADFESLRGDSRFKSLMEDAEKGDRAKHAAV